MNAWVTYNVMLRISHLKAQMYIEKKKKKKKKKNLIH